MDYDIVIATRNRPAALGMSLPLIARQTRQPRKLIIVDASDNPNTLDAVLRACPPAPGVELLVERPARCNSSFQRNLGLRHVEAPVTLFPDDDSLWFPDTAAAMMAVYEQDRDGKVGGVTATPSMRSPLGSTDLLYGFNHVGVLKGKLTVARNRLEDIVAPSPYRTFGRTCPAYRSPPPWVTAQGLPVVETITGFRMSYRTEVVRRYPFDEVLGHKTGYCLFEDILVSLQVLSSGLTLVAAPDARVFHHTFPSRRANGFDYGFSHLGNYAYVCSRVVPHTPAFRSKLENFLRFKLSLYRLKRAPYWRDVYKGALTAWRARQLLWDAPSDRLADAFRAVCDANPSPSLQ